jgi:Zn-dependent peptidase ImmA (M78 family)
LITKFIEPEELEQLVCKKIKELGITSADYPINPNQLIRNEGIEIYERSFTDTNIRGAIMYGSEATAIVINADRSFTSRRFIAMHELSHFWFHPRANKIVCFEEYINNCADKEWQANNAAAYALMPRAMVSELFAASHGDVSYMCDVLKVSPLSLGYRINELGLNIKPEKNLIFSADPDPMLNALHNSWLYGGL